MAKRSYKDWNFNFGDRRLIGQKHVREQLTKVITSDRISHAYLFSGPPGVGKKAFALSFAEIINGIDHFTDLNGHGFSKKSSWFNHPDIHVFLPIPRNVGTEELRKRLELLNDDPYEVVDFSLRPSLESDEQSKNKRAFYSVEYFSEEIKPAAYYTPNEGAKTVILISNIENMRKETANAFLKLLEEPSKDLMFLLTTDNPDALLPTIISRCQHIQMRPLTVDEIQQGLIEYDETEAEEAQYLARVSGGNYSLTRFYDVKTLKETRDQIVDFMRAIYTLDAVKLTDIINGWHSGLNSEGQIALLNTLEIFIRDLIVYRETETASLVTNVDQLNVIKDFCKALGDAKLEEMLEELEPARGWLYQNVQFKLFMTSLAFRYYGYMKNASKLDPFEEAWRHMPAYIESSDA
jgi:DNA polymerase-3 subunit delta'